VTQKPPEITHAPYSLGEIPTKVEDSLREFFAARSPEVAAIGGPVTEAVQFLEDFTLNGGKRIRPLFAWCGFGAAGGWEKREYNPAQVLNAISSLELIQACALIHDDYIDSSDTRRGAPTVHRRAERIHAERGYNGSSEHFGASTCILAGDMAMVWADDMFHGCGLEAEAIARAFEPWRAMRTEVIGGQLLDIHNEAAGTESLELAQNVNRFKTAAYTIERPLHIGAALAGANADTIEALRAYGRDIGIAFQLRDDLLGVFGDPAVTGKPAGDDLREGKRTVLIALALQSADDSTAELIRSGVGTVSSTADIANLADAIKSTGAADEVEALIEDLTASGLAHLGDVELAEGAKENLLALAHKATARRT
jgi:geranylgeranyl diphosphate synthase type I